MKKLVNLTLFLLTLFFSLNSSSVFAVERSETLVVANPADAKTLDPILATDGASMGLMLQIYEGLLRYDFEKQQLLPGLAEKWEKTDETTYRLTLRKGVKFHNGETLTPEDVKFSFDRAMGPGGTANKLYTDPIESVSIVDGDIVFKLKRPFTPFLMSLTFTWSSIVSQKAVEQLGERFGLDATGAGTGPFMFSQWNKGDRIILDRFTDYWDTPAPLARMIMRSVPEATNRTIELESGAVDVSLIVHANDVKRIDANPELKMLRTLDYIVTYMGINQSRKPLGDLRVREALSLALDISGIHKVVWQGSGKVPNGALSWVSLYADHNLPIPQQNTDRAIELLEEAGVKNLKLSLWTADRKERIDAATIIQAQLAEVGITVDVQILEWGAFLDGLLSGKPDLFILGSGYADPGLTFRSMYHSQSNSNYTHTNDPELDRLADESLIIPDGPERAKLFEVLQKRIVELHPALFLNDEEYLIGANKKVQGFKPGPRGYHDLSRIYFSK